MVKLNPEDYYVTEQQVHAQVAEGRLWIKELIRQFQEAVTDDEESRDVFTNLGVSVSVLFDLKPVHVYSLAAVLLNDRIIDELRPEDG